MLPRIFAVIFLFLSVFFLPFWLSIILAIVGMFYFNFFIESAFILLLSDFLYGASEQKFHGVLIVSFFIALFFLTIAEILKKRLKFYKD